MLSRVIQGGLPADRPTFLFVRHLVPHDPLNADCRRSDREMALPLYINAVRRVNREAAKLAALIRSRDPKALVAFQADHGSEFLVDWKRPRAGWSPASIDERTSILNLVHMPPACLQRRPPACVEERSYLTTYETAPDFGRVLRVHR